MSNFIEKIISLGRTYIIAEAGINHNGDMALARKMIIAAKKNGADCIKFQNFIAEKYISRIAGKAGYQKQEAVVTKSQREIIGECEIDRKETAELLDFAKKIGIDFISTPFELDSFGLLMELGLPGIKISSCNLTNYPFLGEVARTRVPVLLSTGMSNLEEVTRAVEIFKRSGSPLILLQCTSNYPSKIKNANLRVISKFRELFNIPLGFSDHTPSSTAAIAAVALGAVVIEKHFTLSRKLPGIDQQASIEPRELKNLIVLIRECESALGKDVKEVVDEEEDTSLALRRSLVAARDLKKGEIITQDMIAIKRPGNGLSTSLLPQLLGKKLNRAVQNDELLRLEDFSS
ncbi:MAG TPA: N-acetylneuraminate synthase [Candidatus Omnitrophica bacterium]|nr:N-acetylneuraminate synthase [Candidatus Omnitrophota bacterium]